MTENFRSGNSRLLAKTLDQLGQPLAILDRRGVIVFVNLALCQVFQVDAAQLVGQACSWQVADDDAPFAALRTALAPPAGALQGKLVARQLTTPIAFGSSHSGQLFLPLLDDEGTPHATAVVLGQWSQLSAQLAVAEPLSLQRRQMQSDVLTRIRSRWQTLDGLHSLLGTSPAIELAMARAQLAIAQPCNLVVCGAMGLDLADIVRSVYLGRLKKAGLSRLAGQLFPVDCRLVDAVRLAEMLDLFTARLHADTPRLSQLLMLEHIEQLDGGSTQYLSQWFGAHGQHCLAAAVSEFRAEQLASRGPNWSQLMSQLSTIEIVVPALSQRRQDIVPLATHLLAVACQSQQRAQLGFTSDALRLLEAFPWPGNYRQLAHAIDDAVERAVLVANIQVNHLPVEVRSYSSASERSELGQIKSIDLDQVLLQCERVMLSRALQLSPRNRAQAARLLGISRPRLLRRIEQLGLAQPGGPSTAEDDRDLGQT